MPDDQNIKEFRCKRNFLIVDDENFNLKALNNQFKKVHANSVDQAINGKDAVEKAMAKE